MYHSLWYSSVKQFSRWPSQPFVYFSWRIFPLYIAWKINVDHSRQQSHKQASAAAVVAGCCWWMMFFGWGAGIGGARWGPSRRRRRRLIIATTDDCTIGNDCGWMDWRTHTYRYTLMHLESIYTAWLGDRMKGKHHTFRSSRRHRGDFDDLKKLSTKCVITDHLYYCYNIDSILINTFKFYLIIFTLIINHCKQLFFFQTKLHLNANAFI